MSKTKLKIAFIFNVVKNKTFEEAEFDTPETIKYISNALKSLSHEVLEIDALCDLQVIIQKLIEFKPNLAINTAEGLKGKHREAIIPTILEELQIPYIGSTPDVCITTLDKYLSKLIVREEGIATPKCEFIDSIEEIDQLESELRKIKLEFPVIIKPNFEGSSKGITEKSIVENIEELKTISIKLLKQFPEGILLEEFIKGVDITVPYIESISPETKGILDSCIYEFSESYEFEKNFAIYDYKLKQILDDHVDVKIAQILSSKLQKYIHDQTYKICRAFNIRDIARIDYRLSTDNKLYFLEINALPSLQEGAAIYIAAAKKGYKDISDVLSAIINHAILSP